MVFMQLLASKPDVAMGLWKFTAWTRTRLTMNTPQRDDLVPQATGSGVETPRKKRNQCCYKRSGWQPLRRWWTIDPMTGQPMQVDPAEILAQECRRYSAADGAGRAGPSIRADLVSSGID